jgi:hypothetical protein
MATGVEAVYQTNLTDTTGKWLVVYKHENEAQVKKFIDDEFPRLYGCIPDECPNKIIPGFECPRREGFQRHNGHTNEPLPPSSIMNLTALQSNGQTLVCPSIDRPALPAR